jgi:hypothetical protein
MISRVYKRGFDQKPRQQFFFLHSGARVRGLIPWSPTNRKNCEFKNRKYIVVEYVDTEEGRVSCTLTVQLNLLKTTHKR